MTAGRGKFTRALHGAITKAGLSHEPRTGGRNPYWVNWITGFIFGSLLPPLAATQIFHLEHIFRFFPLHVQVITGVVVAGLSHLGAKWLEMPSRLPYRARHTLVLLVELVICVLIGGGVVLISRLTAGRPA